MLVITGPMRSGTSIVARIAHQMGVDMGASMRMPPPGSGLDPEYEDSFLAEDLARLAVAAPVTVSWTSLALYIGNRRRKARFLSWGFKSPLLALFWYEWTKALAKAREPMKLVLCGRPGPACLASLARAARNPIELDTLRRIQGRIYEALPDVDARADLVVPFGTAPTQIAKELSALLDLSCDEATAVRGIRT